jgi:hypothetical protein
VRFVLAIISFVLAAVMIALGIAQRTVFAQADQVALSTTIATDAPVTVIEGDTLNAFAGSQRLELSGSDAIFTAYGRTNDVLAWVGDTDYTVVSYDAETGELTNDLVAGAESEVPNPAGSDLWLQEYTGESSLRVTVNVPDSISFIIVSDGVAPAPTDVSLTWPVDNTTPWSGPLIVGGAVVLLIGLVLLLWATNHMRSSRGPRRKPQKMPKVPRKRLYKPVRKTIEKPSTGRRAVTKSVAIVPVFLTAGLVLSGCSADFWPDLGPQPVAPSATATTAAEDAQLDPPAATARQVERIVAQISETTAQADAAKDTALLETRFSGAALELRIASYAIQTADSSIAGLAAIPAGPVELTLPQQTDTWPRSVFAVIQPEDDTVAPVALFLEQADPRANYKVSYAITLEPSEGIPDVAPANIGAPPLAVDSQLLRVAPEDVTLAYSDILQTGLESDSYLDFEEDGDTLRQAVTEYQNSIKGSLPATATAAFGYAVGPATPIALATNDAGALVAVNLYETTTVTPVEEGAAVNPSGQVKALSGLAISTKGVIATYSDQLLFYVPPAGGDAKIVLLGYSQGLVKAGEVG